MRPRGIAVLAGCAVVLIAASAFGTRALVALGETREERAAERRLQGEIDAVVGARREALAGENGDPFAGRDSIRVLLLGLDTRTAQTTGHCDAIQMIEIDRANAAVRITAVPRGTYAPLPGSGHAAGDYYLSNACAIGGLDYGIAQIERVLGQEADYVAMVGFSEALGAFRLLDLPTTETLRWLRMRQGYGVGEPQRAHNHSTFLRQALTTFVPTSDTKADAAWEYLLYRLVDTDLGFGQARAIVRALSEMDLAAHPERITLSMRPSYEVADIAYDPESLDAYLSSMIDPIAASIPEGAYTGISEEDAQRRLMDAVRAGMSDPGFVTRAYESRLWLQIEDAADRESVHFSLVLSYLAIQPQEFDRQTIWAEYVIEMETLGLSEWADVGRAALADVVE